MNEFVVNEFSD